MLTHLIRAVAITGFAASTVAAQAPAPRPAQTLPAYVQGQYATLKRNLTGSAEKMPAEHFAYRPAPEVMTYAELLSHTMQTQYGACATVKGVPNPAAGKDLQKSITSQPDVIKMVADTFAFCDDAFAGLTNENALELITAGVAPNQRQLARVNQLLLVVVHGNEHYGNLVTYMRTKGIVPPSSAQ